MGKKKTTTKSTSNQTQQATPWSPVQPGLTDLAGRVNTALGQLPGAYEGQFIATPGAMQQAVLPAMQQAGALSGSLIAPAMQAATQTNWQMPQFQGPGLQQGTGSFAQYDPSGVQSVIQGAMQPYLRQLTEQILPSLQSSGIESGAYSNDRMMALMPQTAIRDTSRMAAEVGSQIAYQDFADQQARALQAYGLGTQRGLGEADVLTQRLGMYPGLLDMVTGLAGQQAGYTQQAADYETAMRQAEINNQLAAHDYAVRQPFQGLDTAAQLYGTFAPYATQTSQGSQTQTQTQSGGLMGQLLQGAMGIGGMMLGSPGGLSMLGLGGASAANPLLNTQAMTDFANFNIPMNYLNYQNLIPR